MKRLFVIFAMLLTVACSDTPVEPTKSVPSLALVVRDAPVERRVFVHYRPGFARPEGKGKPPTENTNSCFAALAKGATWTNAEPFRTTFPLPIATWEFENDIFGSEEAGAVPPFDGTVMDGLNTAQFGFYTNSNVIAVTVVWGIFRGPPGGRELLEWDLLMNTQFTFGDADVDPTVMDIENIAAHELGHALGLGHPDNSCIEETMYAFSSTGETIKRTLEAGDIAGVRSLY